jgi:excisionase family DNA binding protein
LSNQETRQTISKPFEELNAKPYLSIPETCQLLGVSRRTLYRMMERGNLRIGKMGARTIIRRSDIENLF